MSYYKFQKSNPEHVNSKGLPDKFWDILIVDDDQYIHDVTTLVLSNMLIDGRRVKLHHAGTAQEARNILETHRQICLAFIDIVMETDEAGLQLVEWIRYQQHNKYIRLILRTAQPGATPEEYIINQYDINDYRTKTEFTALKMKTSVLVGVRGYRDLIALDKNLETFKQLAVSSTNILKIQDRDQVIIGVLENLTNVLKVGCLSVYIVRRELDYEETYNEKTWGHFVGPSGGSACGKQMDLQIRNVISESFKNSKSTLSEGYFVGYCKSSSSISSVIYIEFSESPDHFDDVIAELYTTTIVLILENLERQQQVEHSQRELLYIVGEAVEARSKETGHHVKRVALMCNLLAVRLGLSESYCKNIKIAAPLHDIGKIAIPEKILHKPGKLDDAEWAIMKTHAELGGALIERSDLPVAKLAARLARYHHENWDGSGYPEGLSGQAIPLEARIMAIVDVIDALGSVRSYKNAWTAREIVKYIREQSGIKFDPTLVEVAFTNFDDLMLIRESFPD